MGDSFHRGACCVTTEGHRQYYLYGRGQAIFETDRGWEGSGVVNNGMIDHWVQPLRYISVGSTELCGRERHTPFYLLVVDNAFSSFSRGRLKQSVSDVPLKLLADAGSVLELFSLVS